MEELLQITVSPSTILSYVFGGLLTVVGFFLKNAWTDIKDLRRQRELDKEEVGKLKGKIELVDQRSGLEMQNVSDNVGKLTDEIKEMNAEMKSKHKDMMSIFAKLLKQ